MVWLGGVRLGQVNLRERHTMKQQAKAAAATTRVVVGNKTKQFDEADIPIVGTAPLLVAHPMPWDIGGAFWEQHPREIAEAKNPADVLQPSDHALLKSLGFPVNGKLTPQAEAHLRGYWLPDLTPAYPASGFMGACRTAVVQYKGKGRDALTAKKVGGAMQVLGHDADRSLVAIEGPFALNVTIGKNSGMTAAPRIITRLEFAAGWRAVLRVRWISQLLTAQDVLQVVAWAGNWGIGQWRPSSAHAGQHGTWALADSNTPN